MSGRPQTKRGSITGKERLLGALVWGRGGPVPRLCHKMWTTVQWIRVVCCRGAACSVVNLLSGTTNFMIMHAWFTRYTCVFSATRGSTLLLTCATTATSSMGTTPISSAPTVESFLVTNRICVCTWPKPTETWVTPKSDTKQRTRLIHHRFKIPSNKISPRCDKVGMREMKMKYMPVTWALMEVLKDVNKDRWFKKTTCILGAVYQSCRINCRFYFVIKV